MTRIENLIRLDAVHDQGASQDSAGALKSEAGLCRPEEELFGCSGCQECGFCRRDAQQDSGQGASTPCG